MFRAAHRSSSGALNCICSLWFIYTCGDRPLPRQRPVTTWAYKTEESYRLCCVVVCDLETSRMGAPYIYDISSLRVNENPSSGGRVVSCGQPNGQTDMTKPVVTFRNFANAPKIKKLSASVRIFFFP